MLISKILLQIFTIFNMGHHTKIWKNSSWNSWTNY